MRGAFGAVVLSALLATGCSGGDSAGPTTTLQRDASVSDDEITPATADRLHACASAVAALLHFDESWLTSSTPPDTVAELDDDLLAAASDECEAAMVAVVADSDPVAGRGMVFEVQAQVQTVLDLLDAPEVDLAPNGGLPLAMLNIESMSKGEFGVSVRG